uniref:Uncharacterized protein n=1 Tax=Ciona savignyi TaxID=51511 RepID=H2YFY6_CIOSA
MEFPMITPTETPCAREIPLDPEDPMIISTSTLCSENRDDPVTFDPVTFDPVDIYARRVSSDCLVCSPMSPGNSLLCG